MKRIVVLSMLVAAGVVPMAVVVARQAAQPVALQVDKVKDNLFVLKGGGGNTAVFIMASGVVVVDAKNPGMGQPILDKIKELTPKPVTMLINTHTHGDHVGGNSEFPATIDIIVQDNTKANMARMPQFQNGGRGMPTRTFKDKLTVGKGADEIDLFFFGPGHTNGDAWVVFPALRAVHAGDLFASKGLPLVDSANGGSVLYYADTLRKAHAGIKNVDTVINGHNATTTTWDDLQMFADFNQDFLTWAQAELKAGKTPEQAAAEWKVPDKYVAAGYSAAASTNFGGLAQRIQTLVDEMKRK